MFKLLLCSIFFLGSVTMTAQDNFETDIFKTTAGDLKITFIGHGSLLFNFKNLAIYIDPYGQLADFSLMHKADIIFITHQHQDHFDSAAIEKLRQKNTHIFLTAACQPVPAASRSLKNGDSLSEQGIDIAVVPAYNIIHKRENNVAFHPRGEGNGYVFTFADLMVYVAGDTENIPEMVGLKNIAVAFLPMNLPYTMTPEMTAKAAQLFKPRILYPYHFGNTDPRLLPPLLADEAEITVRIRKMN
jgi:L-ascorbate metabolism protein UlaG (beta-lactamase superfamily)